MTPCSRFVRRAAAALACVMLLVLAGPSAFARLAPRHLLRVSGLTSLFAGGPGALAIVLVEREPGKASAPERPVPGAAIQVELKGASGPPLFEGRTDDSGNVVARFTVPEGLTGKQRLEVTSLHADGEQMLLVYVEVRDPSAERLLHLATDKPMYQPSQTIHFRSLVLRALDLTAIAGAPVTFEVRAPGGELVHRRSHAAGEFGVAVGAFELGPEVPLGSYTIRAESGGVTTERTVEVSSYVLPAYKVEVDLDRPYYRPGELLKAKIRADYTFGKPVADASLDLNVVALVSGSPVSLHRAYARTDAEGRYEASFRIPAEHWALAKGFKSAPLSFEVVARDRAGETIVKTESSVLAEDVLLVKLVPGTSPMIAGVPNVMFVAVHYPDGKPAADCAVRIEGVGEEITGKAGIARLKVTPPAGKSRVTLELELVDAYGNRAKTAETLSTRREGLAVHPGRSLYRAGETATFDVYLPEGARGVGVVHVELSRRGLLVASLGVPVAGGRAHLELPLGDDGWGTVEAHAHVQVGKQLWSGSASIYVQPARKVDVTITPDRESYLPGDTAALALGVRGADGAGVAAAVMLKVVDERLYALEDAEREKLLLYFTLDEPLRRPDDPVMAEASKIGFGAALTKKEAEKAAKAEAASRDRAAGLLLAYFAGDSEGTVLFAADSEAQALERARTEIDALAERLRTSRPYYHYKGKIGRPIAWLVKHEALDAEAALDVWGRSYRVEGRGLGHVKYYLISVGLDGKRGGDDDLERKLF